MCDCREDLCNECSSRRFINAMAEGLRAMPRSKAPSAARKDAQLRRRDLSAQLREREEAI